METGSWLLLLLHWIPGVFLGLVFQSVATGNRMTSPKPTTTHVTSGSSSGVCPSGCFCSVLSRIVYCSRRGLVEIPVGVPEDSLQLNMNGNHFRVPVLQRSNLSQLPQLEHLYLSECGIEGIDFGTFLDLPRLKWLDLSNNRLKALIPRSFQGLNLLHLFLNGNRNLILDLASFEGLVTVGLYLHDCSLSWLAPEALAPLRTSLKYLWLNGNELATLDSRFEELFKSVAHLRLSSNPLHCNCRLGWLKALFDSSGDIFKGAVAPSCLGPTRLKGKFLGEAPLSEFRCQPPTFKNIDAAFDLGAGRLDCRAYGDPAPDLYWIKPSGWTVRFAAHERQDPRSNEASLLVSRADSDPHLFGMYICVATNEAGNATLTINVSWPVHNEDSTASADFYSATTLSRAPLSPEVLVPDQTTDKESAGNGISNLEEHHDELPMTTRPNYTLIGSPDGSPGSLAPHQETRMFSVLQMVFAVVGSHVCTLVLCLMTVPFCYRSRWTRLKPRSVPVDEAKGCREKFPAPEASAAVPESPSGNATTGCSQFYLPDYFITSPQ